jgi:hypothetical protein
MEKEDERVEMESKQRLLHDVQYTVLTQIFRQFSLFFFACWSDEEESKVDSLQLSALSENVCTFSANFRVHNDNFKQ